MNLKDYIQGKRHGKEANELERKAMNNAFLQDALDGFDTVQGEHLPVIEELEKRIGKEKKPKKNNLRIYAWATVAIIALFLGFQFFKWLQPDELINTPVVATKETKLKPDTIILQQPPKDTRLVSDNIKKTTKQSIKKKPEIKASPPAETEDTLEEVTAIGFNTEKRSNLDYVNSMTSLKSKELGFDSRLDSTNDLYGYLSSANKQINTNSLQGKVAGISIQQYENASLLKNDSMKYNSSLSGRIAGIDVAKNQNNIRIRGTSSLSNNSPIKIVKGRLIDENREPIIGANVTLKNTHYGTTTNTNGEFFFVLPQGEKDSLLVASYIGYENKELALNKNLGDVQLYPNEMALNEVVTIGYGTKKSIFAKKYHYGEKEFIDYFKQNYDKNICPEQKIDIKATFKLNEYGRPTEIKTVKTNCPEMESEVKKWLEKSPNWTNRNKEISLKFSIKN
ncbi:conserved hypothetical protein [uncultured Paludibacter sp.]|nr:conserved hypothetical protein [uncultured Paludibacter sp.]